MDKNPQSAPVAPAPVAPTPVKTPSVHDEPRNFLVTFLLTSTFGLLGLRHFYLGDKKLGWLRLGLLVGGYALMLIGAVAGTVGLVFLGGAAIFAAYVWALVDFFYVYFSVKTDAEGQPLVATPRDKKWAKVLFWTAVGLGIAYIVGTALLFSFAQSSFTDSLNETNRSNDFNNSFFDETTTPNSFQRSY